MEPENFVVDLEKLDETDMQWHAVARKTLGSNIFWSESLLFWEKLVN